MSGRPHAAGVEKVVLITRRLNLLTEEFRDNKNAIAALNKRQESIDDRYNQLDRERKKLLESMDVHPNQTGNYGSEARHAAFLSLMASCSVEGAADEPE